MGSPRSPLRSASYELPPQSGYRPCAAESGPRDATPTRPHGLPFLLPTAGRPGRREAFRMANCGSGGPSRRSPGCRQRSGFLSARRCCHQRIHGSNQKTITNPSPGKRDDWFELYNGGNEPVDLTGYFLTDVLTNANKFEIPPDLSSCPLDSPLWGRRSHQGEHQRIPSTPRELQAVHRRGGPGPLRRDGALVDGLSFHAQADDVSLGRFPDGAPDRWSYRHGSPAAANELAGGNRPPKLDAIPQHRFWRVPCSASRFTPPTTPRSPYATACPDAPVGTRTTNPPASSRGPYVAQGLV